MFHDPVYNKHKDLIKKIFYKKHSIFWFIINMRVSRSLTKKTEIYSLNFKILGICVISFIYPTFSSFLFDVGL